MKNYAIMRHAEYIKGTDRLSKSGIEKTRKIAKRILSLAKKNNFETIQIFHSISKRTIDTAFVLSSTIGAMVTDIIELFPLREENRSISEKMVIDIAENKKIFYIFITHKPNITLFLAKKGIVEKNIDFLYFWTENIKSTD